MTREDERSNLGRQLWMELHHYAWQYPREPLAAHRQDAREWLAAWALRIPTFGCRCHAEWVTIMELSPPPLDNAAAFYWWTAAAHDRVNRKLHKPLAAPTWSLHHLLLVQP